MRKKKLLPIMTTGIILAMASGCSSVPKEKEIQEDLANYNINQGLLDQEEIINEIYIDNRDTNKEQRYDKVLCTITTEKDNISYEKKATLLYHKYEKGWELEDVRVNDSKEWIITPLKGVDVETISHSLISETIEINGETWTIDNEDVSDITIQKQETSLENKTDKVILNLVIDDSVEQATGKVVANYIFDKKWELVSISDDGGFKVETKPEKALNVTENDLLEKLDGQIVKYGETRTDFGEISMIDNSTQQDITVSKEGIIDFKIDSHEIKNKGTEQIYKCSCKMKKNRATFILNIEYSYYYDVDWKMQPLTIELQFDSVDIVGEWTGRYNGISTDGTSVLNIISVDGDMITGTYSYTPDEISKYKQPGSYTVSGVWDKERMLLNLQAGDWIVKPDRALSTEKHDINAIYYVEKSKIRGRGQESNIFEVTR
ncbi:MAG: hypothetical protein ACI319_01215 [Holdemanella porci]